MTEKCPRKVWRGDDWQGGYEPCGKPVKRRGVCGVHANQLEAAEQRERDRELRAADRDAASAEARRLRVLTGLAWNVYSGAVGLSTADARLLAARLEAS